MLDVTMLRKNLPEVVARLKTRNFDFPVEAFTELEDRRKNVQQKTEELQAARNALSKDIGMKKKAGEDATELLARAAEIPAQLAELEDELEETRTSLVGSEMCIRDSICTARSLSSCSTFIRANRAIPSATPRTSSLRPR